MQSAPVQSLLLSLRRGASDGTQQCSCGLDTSVLEATSTQHFDGTHDPEAGFMVVRQTALPAYNVQTAVDTEHALIVAHTLWCSMHLISVA